LNKLKSKGSVQTFSVETKDSRIYVLQAENEKDFKEWADALIVVSQHRALSQTMICGEDESGWLEKRGKINKSFKRRFFRLFVNHLSPGPVYLQYYKTESASEPRGSIEIPKVEKGKVNEIIRRINGTQISVYDRYRVYILQTKEQGDIERWVKCLEKAIVLPTTVLRMFF